MEHLALIKQIGEGSYGRVCLMLNAKTKTYDVVKLIHKSHCKYIQNEVDNHMLCNNHPNIIGFQWVEQLEDFICIGLEYAEGGDLFSSLIRQPKKRFSERHAAMIMVQILKAVDHCHVLGVYHRDIKLENILIQNNIVKLCDFGYSATKVEKDDAVGSFGYLAPEIILRNVKDGTKIDIWCCAVIMYALVCGKYPFEHTKEIKDHLLKILNCEYTLPDFVSLEFKDLMSKLFVSDPNKRISIKAWLSHPWMLYE